MNNRRTWEISVEALSITSASKGLLTRSDPVTVSVPVKFYHCANGDGTSGGQNRFHTHSARKMGCHHKHNDKTWQWQDGDGDGVRTCKHTLTLTFYSNHSDQKNCRNCWCSLIHYKSSFDINVEDKMKQSKHTHIRLHKHNSSSTNGK